MIKITKNWFNVLDDEFKKPYFKELLNFLTLEYQHKTIYPPMQNIFDSLNYCKFDNVKVVIIGQDPYHQPNQAHGLCFSVKDGTQLPPSLRNIFKEIESDLHIKCFPSGDLSRWARQGVLLLNSVLTVCANHPNSHKNKGWENFTKSVIEKINKKEKQTIFVLWGNNAKSFLPLINTNKHIVLTASHPSPLSAYNGFFGCHHFSKINEILTQNGDTIIDWR